MSAAVTTRAAREARRTCRETRVYRVRYQHGFHTVEATSLPNLLAYLSREVEREPWRYPLPLSVEAT